MKKCEFSANLLQSLVLVLVIAWLCYRKELDKVVYYAYPNLNAYRASAGILVIWSALVGLVLLAWAWDWMRRRGSGVMLKVG